MKITTNNARTECWDALVIGAGPAGTLASRELARRGMKTLLVDSSVFPRDKVCGGYINGRALSVLKHLGLGTICEDIGAKPLSEVEIRAGNQKLNIPVPAGFAVSRRSLDAAMVQEAIRSGVEFLPKAKATVTKDLTSNYRCVHLQQRDKAPTIIHAKVVLACDGLNHSSLQELHEFRSRISPHARIGIGGVIKDSSSCYSNGRVFMTIGRRGYVGVTRVEGENICLAAVLDVDYVRKLGMREAVLSIMRNGDTPISNSLFKMAYRGTPLLTRKSPILAKERLFLLGDAAGYIEPFTGEGMAMAWTGAKQIVPIAVRAAESWNPSLVKLWEREYQRTVEKRMTICRVLTSMLRYPLAVRIALGILGTYPKLCTRIVGRINQVPFDLKACNP